MTAEKLGSGAAAKKDTPGKAIPSEPIDSTNWIQLGADGDYECAQGPTAAAMLDWVKGSGTVLKVRAKVSRDGVSFQWAPSYGAASSGVSSASIAQLNFAAATWDIDSGTTSRLPVSFDIPEWPYFQLWVQSDSATGSISGTVGSGRDG